LNNRTTAFAFDRTAKAKIFSGKEKLQSLQKQKPTEISEIEIAEIEIVLC